MARERMYKEAQKTMSIMLPPTYIKMLDKQAKAKFGREGNRCMLIRFLVEQFLQKELGKDFEDRLS